MTPATPAGPSVPPSWFTGTALDEFTPIYRALHPGLSPAEVDASDISIIAALLGVTGDGMKAQVADLTRQRMLAAQKGETFTWSQASA